MTKIDTTTVRREGEVAPPSQDAFDIDFREVRAERFSGVGGNDGEAGTTITTTVTISITKYVTVLLRIC